MRHLSFLALLFVFLSTGLSKPRDDKTYSKTIIDLDAELFEDARTGLCNGLSKIEVGLKNDKKYREANDVKAYVKLLNGQELRINLNKTIEFTFKYEKYSDSRLALHRVSEDDNDNLILVLLDYAVYLLKKIQSGLDKDNKVKEAIQAEIYRNEIFHQIRPTFKKCFDLYEHFENYLPKNKLLSFSSDSRNMEV